MMVIDNLAPGFAAKSRAETCADDADTSIQYSGEKEQYADHGFYL